MSEFGSKEEMLIKFPFVETAENEDLNAIVANILKPSGDFEIRKFDTVGPRVGERIERKGHFVADFSVNSDHGLCEFPL